MENKTKYLLATLAFFAVFACSLSVVGLFMYGAYEYQIGVGTPVFHLATRTPLSTRTVAPTQTRTPNPTRTPRPTFTPRPTSTPEYGTMDSPIEFGDYAYLTLNETVDFRISIVSVVRGQDALGIVLDENQFNEIPDDGMEYIVFVAEIAYTGVGSEILEINEYLWGVLSNGRIFDWTLAVCCFDGVKLAKGGVADETVALQVFVGDEDPLLIFGEKFYFKTQ